MVLELVVEQNDPAGQVTFKVVPSQYSPLVVHAEHTLLTEAVGAVVSWVPAEHYAVHPTAALAPPRQ